MTPNDKVEIGGDRLLRHLIYIVGRCGKSEVNKSESLLHVVDRSQFGADSFSKNTMEAMENMGAIDENRGLCGR
jgi:hypothetical protein